MRTGRVLARRSERRTIVPVGSEAIRHWPFCSVSPTSTSTGRAPASKTPSGVQHPERGGPDADARLAHGHRAVDEHGVDLVGDDGRAGAVVPRPGRRRGEERPARRGGARRSRRRRAPSPGRSPAARRRAPGPGGAVGSAASPTCRSTVTSDEPGTDAQPAASSSREEEQHHPAHPRHRITEDVPGPEGGAGSGSVGSGQGRLGQGRLGQGGSGCRPRRSSRPASPASASGGGSAVPAVAAASWMPGSAAAGAAATGSRGSGLVRRRSPWRSGSVRRKTAPLVDLAPRLQPAAVQAGVLQADRQPEPGAAAAPLAGRVGAPEPVEHEPGLARLAARRRGRAPRPRTRPRRRPGAPRWAGPRRGRWRWRAGCAGCARRGAGRSRRGPGRPRSSSSGVPVASTRCRTVSADAPHDRADVDLLEAQLGHAGVEAADLQQVGEQRLEAVELVDQQLRRARRGHLGGVDLGVQDLGGHAHRGQRRAQLVADVGGEPALQRPELLELADLRLDARRHLVVRLREPGHLVVAVDRHAFVEVAVGEPFGDVGGLAHRAHDLAGDHRRDAREQHEQDPGGERERALDQRERALLGREREEQVELQVRGPRCAPAGRRRASGTGAAWPDEATVRYLVARKPCSTGARSCGGMTSAGPALTSTVTPPGTVGRAPGAAGAHGVRAGDEHGVERAGVARRVAAPGQAVLVGTLAAGGQPVEDVVEHGLGAVAVGVDAREVALEGLAGDVRLDQGGLLLALHEPVGDLGLQHQAEHGHDDDGHRQRRQHDAQLHRAPPEHPDLTHPLGGEALETTTQARQHGVPRRPGLRAARPCTRRRAPSARPRGAPGRSRPWSAAAARGR